MRLEPVLLVAPSAQPAVMPTRRAFMLASGSLLIGAAAGGACGYSLGASRVSVPATPSDQEATTEPSTGDAMLDELRRLAVKAPIEELVQRGVFFGYQRDVVYPRDAVLWRGIERLAQHIDAHPGEVDRSVLLIVLATIERGNPPEALQLDRFLPELRRQRSNRK